MTNISLHLDKIYNFVSDDEIKAYKQVSEKQNIALREKTGKGNDYLGWVDLPSSISEEMLSRCKHFYESSEGCPEKEQLRAILDQ